MEQIPTTTPEAILEQLGYIEAPENNPIVNSKTSELVYRLNLIDLAISSAVNDSMAVKVGDLAVDYGKHIYLMKQEGTRLLKQLAILSSVPLYYDKYVGRHASEQSITPLRVTNYY